MVRIADPKPHSNSSFWSTVRRIYDSFCYGLTFSLGVCVDALQGPSQTAIFEGESKHAVEVLRPSVEDRDGVQLHITAREIIYHTRFTRFWVPDMKRTVYEVTGSVSEQYRDKFDSRLFETVTYPMLCNPLLQWTRYPHMYAIHAYIDRVYPTNHPYRC